MAHEINNPLSGMLQTAMVMENRLTTSFNIPASIKAAKEAGTTLEAIEHFIKARDIHRMLDTIITSGKRMANVVDNMLSFARKNDEGAAPHYLDVLINQTLGLAATDFDVKKHYDFKRIKIIKQYADNVPAVLCQSSKIQQVLLNIFVNGAQAMQANGTQNPQFIVRTSEDPISKMACLEIEDNGPGMDEATRKKVFDPFFTTKSQGLGTGLGLSVSYFIITENHMGEMSVESQPEAGARFIIKLPLAR
jgi:signal transduction histidine kinase